MADSTEALENSSNFLDIDGFPDDIILEIFGKLLFLDLCNCAKVCRRWYILSHSLHLKKIVIDQHLKLQQLSLLIQDHFPQHLETFELLKESLIPLTYVKRYVLLKLRAKCPRIKRLVLARCSLVSVSIDDMPKTLQYLSIRGSEIHPYEFFKKPGDEKDRPQLTCLDVAEVSNCLTSENLYILLPLKSLHCLYLENCFRINNGGIESIIELLPQLKILDVEGTDISNEGLQIILTYCVNVEELYIGHTCIDDDAVESPEIFSQVAKLSVLCIRNTQFTCVFVRLLNQCLGNRVKLLTQFDSSVNRNGRHLEDLSQFIGCNHYLSHTCC